ncbi:MAG: hypothetical protein ACLTDM_07135 [Clostridium butyricum]
MKGSFLHDGKVIKYKFKISKYANIPTISRAYIDYKKRFQIMSDYILVEEASYDFLISKYWDLSDEEIRDICESEIRKDIMNKHKTNRFK